MDALMKDVMDAIVNNSPPALFRIVDEENPLTVIEEMSRTMDIKSLSISKDEETVRSEAYNIDLEMYLFMKIDIDRYRCYYENVYEDEDASEYDFNFSDIILEVVDVFICHSLSGKNISNISITLTGTGPHIGPYNANVSYGRNPESEDPNSKMWFKRIFYSIDGLDSYIRA